MRTDIYAILVHCHPREHLRQGGIYAIVHISSGRTYIGRTKRRFDVRWQKHISDLERGQHICPSFQQDWTRDGWSAFRFEILEIIDAYRNSYYFRLSEWTRIKSLENPYNQNLDEPIPNGLIRRPT